MPFRPTFTVADSGEVDVLNPARLTPYANQVYCRSGYEHNVKSWISFLASISCPISDVWLMGVTPLSLADPDLPHVLDYRSRKPGQ